MASVHQRTKPSQNGKTPYYGVQASDYADNQRMIESEMKDPNYRGRRRADQPLKHLRIHTADAPYDPEDEFTRKSHPLEEQRREQAKARKAREKAISILCAFEIQSLKNVIDHGRTCFVQHYPVFGRIFKQALPALIIQRLFFQNQPNDHALPECGFPRHGRHWTFNTYEELERDLGFPARSIRRWCQKLKQDGWLHIRSARVQRRKTNLFSINRPKLIHAVLNNTPWTGYSLIPRNADFKAGDPVFDHWADIVTSNSAVKRGRKNNPEFDALLTQYFAED